MTHLDMPSDDARYMSVLGDESYKVVSGGHGMPVTHHVSMYVDVYTHTDTSRQMHMYARMSHWCLVLYASTVTRMGSMLGGLGLGSAARAGHICNGWSMQRGKYATLVGRIDIMTTDMSCMCVIYGRRGREGGQGRQISACRARR